MKKTVALLAISLLSAPLLAQAQAPAQAPPAAKPAAPPAQQPVSVADKTFQEAVKLVQAGDAAGALVKLQALEKDPAVTPPVRSLLGALYLQINRPKEALAALQPLADSENAEPAVLYNAGRAAILSGNVDAGRLYLTRSVLKEPASPAARDLGFLTAREGRVVEAYSMLRPWALRNPKDTDARLMAASLALQLERPDAAAELIQGLPETEPALRLLRGKILVQKKDGPGAVAILRPLLANHPQGMDLEIRRNLAEAELLAGNAAEAVKLIEGHTTGHPTVALLLAKAQRKAGNAAAALATLKPLADQLPTNANEMGDPRPAAGIALEYGTLLLEAGKAQEAGPFLERSTLYYPRNPEAWKALAKALEASGRTEDASKALAQAVEAAKPPMKPAGAGAAPSAQGGTASAASGSGTGAATPEPPLGEGLQNALRLMGQGQIEPALTAVRQEAGISKDPRAKLLEVRLLLQLKRPEEALKAAEAAVQSDPNNPDYLYLRGVAAMGQQRWSSAEQDLRKVLQLSPQHTGAMNDLAVLLMNLNKKDEAMKLLQQVLQINPQDRMAAANLQRLQSGK
jgi:predicted Zn-dependent protease